MKVAQAKTDVATMNSNCLNNQTNNHCCKRTEQSSSSAFTLMLEQLGQNKEVLCKSQQRDEIDVSVQEKIQILTELFDKSKGNFLARFGKYLTMEQLKLFENLDDSITDNYEIKFHLKNMFSTSTSIKRHKQIRNKRYAALKHLITKGSYFSEVEMMKRNPLLYEHLVGRFLSNEEKRIRDRGSNNNLNSFVHVLLDGIEKQQMENKKKLQEEAENVRGANDFFSSDSDEECNAHLDQKPQRFLWGEIPENNERSPPMRIIQQVDVSITVQEKQILKEEFVSTMYEHFLDGKDEDFDYSTVDNNEEYDNLKIIEYDEEEKYFDLDDTENVNMTVEGEKEQESSEDELDIYMNALNQHPSSMRNRNRRWLLAWTFASLFPHIMLYEGVTEHGGHLKDNTNEARGVFTPRMNYEQWTPLGRGDPLKNDPTYDYVPPMLDHVHYWIETSSKKPDSSITNNNQKTEILVLGVSAKKSSVGTSTPAESRKDVYDSFLKFAEAPKLGMPSNYQRMSRPPYYYHHHNYHHRQHYYPVSTIENKNKIENVASAKNEQILYTFLKPPPVSLNNHNTIQFSETLNPVVTTESPSTIIVTKVPGTSHTVEESSLLYQSSTIQNEKRFTEHFGIDGASSSQVTWRTPASGEAELNITYRKNSNSNNVEDITKISQTMHKGQVRDDEIDIANTYVSIAKPEAQMHSPEIISSLAVEVPKMLSKSITQLINSNFKTQMQKITPMTMQTLHTMQTMKPPPILPTPVFETSLHNLLQSEVTTNNVWSTLPSNKFKLNSTTYSPMETASISLTTDPFFKHYKQPNEPLKNPMHLIIQGHSKVKTYGPNKQDHELLVQETNEIPTSEEKEDYIVKHLHAYKKDMNDGRLRQGRSSILQTLSHVVQTGLGAIDYTENEANSRNNDVQETEVIVSYDVSGQTDTTSERYYKGIVEPGDIVRNNKSIISVT
ncbi:hypothetical protein FQR65_LT01638 [Abscondita terminalis]|nr:hypothetical protein FQR65_LT01638 [Abscondita terminalis]